MTLQSQFTFEGAKKFTLNGLSHLITFAESMFEISPNPHTMEYLIQLETLQERIKQINSPRLFEIEILQVQRFGQAITYFNPDLEPQLGQFWELHIRLLVYLQTTKTPFAIRDRISEAWESIKEIDSISQEIVGLAHKNYSDALSATALLLIHIIRVERIEKTLLEQIIKSANILPDQNSFDAYSICSVTSKVRRYNSWRTDVRTIRDLTAHCKFKLTISPKSWEISYNSHSDGWNFERTFNDKEFVRFFDKFTLLYKSQLILLLIFEMLPVLTLHFWRR